MLGVSSNALGGLLGGEEVAGEVPFQQGGLAGAFQGMGSCWKDVRREENGVY
jgi:hypothetical protein